MTPFCDKKIFGLIAALKFSVDKAEDESIVNEWINK